MALNVLALAILAGAQASGSVDLTIELDPKERFAQDLMVPTGRTIAFVGAVDPRIREAIVVGKGTTLARATVRGGRVNASFPTKGFSQGQHTLEVLGVVPGEPSIFLGKYRLSVIDLGTLRFEGSFHPSSLSFHIRVTPPSPTADRIRARIDGSYPWTALEEGALTLNPVSLSPGLTSLQLAFSSGKGELLLEPLTIAVPELLALDPTRLTLERTAHGGAVELKIVAPFAIESGAIRVGDNEFPLREGKASLAADCLSEGSNALTISVKDVGGKSYVQQQPLAVVFSEEYGLVYYDTLLQSRAKHISGALQSVLGAVSGALRSDGDVLVWDDLSRRTRVQRKVGEHLHLKPQRLQVLTQVVPALEALRTKLPESTPKLVLLKLKGKEHDSQAVLDLALQIAHLTKGQLSIALGERPIEVTRQIDEELSLTRPVPELADELAKYCEGLLADGRAGTYEGIGPLPSWDVITKRIRAWAAFKIAFLEKVRGANEVFQRRSNRRGYLDPKVLAQMEEQSIAAELTGMVAALKAIRTRPLASSNATLALHRAVDNWILAAQCLADRLGERERLAKLRSTPADGVSAQRERDRAIKASESRIARLPHEAARRLVVANEHLADACEMFNEGYALAES